MDIIFFLQIASGLLTSTYILRKANEDAILVLWYGFQDPFPTKSDLVTYDCILLNEVQTDKVNHRF